MKLPNNDTTLSAWELQQIAFNHLSDIDLKGFMNLYQKCTAKPYSVTLISDDHLHFRKNYSERTYKHLSWQFLIRFEMKDYNAILIGRQQKY